MILSCVSNIFFHFKKCTHIMHDCVDGQGVGAAKPHMDEWKISLIFTGQGGKGCGEEALRVISHKCSLSKNDCDKMKNDLIKKLREF